MPPLYEWECPHCGSKMEVMRSFDGYLEPPTEEEGGKCSDDGEHIWKKNIGTPKIVRGRGWQGRKGSW